MREAPTRSKSSTPGLDGFLETRDALRAAPVGDGGLEVCNLLTSALDKGLRAVCDEAGLGPGVSVVATGGYGRSELSFFSDVDLMILHEEVDQASVAATVFRPLWDAGLRVGHSVRSIRDAKAAAKDRFETHTNLLTSRLVAGDEELYERYSTEIAAITKARPLRRHLVTDELRRRQISPYLLMATDIKDGRGGLRTAQGFEWERRREDMIGRFSPRPEPEEANAYRALLRIRNALHASAGRSYDTFSLDLRGPASAWLGVDVFEVSGDLVRAIDTVDSLASRRWPELVHSDRSLVKRTWTRVAWNKTSAVDTAETLQGLCQILRSGEVGRLKINETSRQGLLADIIPELEAVVGLPQLAPFHEHPVDIHLWRTVHEMQELIDGEDHFVEIAQEVADADLLTISAFLHDIGKGRGGDHSEIGSAIALRVCERMAMPSADAGLVSAAVKHHLLLPETATRRDLDDAAVIQDVSDRVGSLRLLHVLYLLAVADSKATGPTMWGEWKAKLLRTLFSRCAAVLGGEARMHETTRENLMEATRSDMRTAVSQHVDQMPDDYLRRHNVDDVIRHTDLVEGLDATARLGVVPGAVPNTVVVVGPRRSGFRRVVAEVFAANGLDVLEARLMSRSDGVAVDTYVVHDDRTAAAPAEGKWDVVRADVNHALAGDLDISARVASRAASYSSPRDIVIDARVVIGVDEASADGVITIKCSDRIGRLAEILGVLDERAIDIKLAKIEARSGEVVDTFHVNPSSIPPDRKGMEILASDIRARIID